MAYNDWDFPCRLHVSLVPSLSNPEIFHTASDKNLRIGKAGHVYWTAFHDSLTSDLFLTGCSKAAEDHPCGIQGHLFPHSSLQTEHEAIGKIQTCFSQLPVAPSRQIPVV